MTYHTNLLSTGGRKRRVGFTLIELLVVVAIIALLISMLLPSLAKAKETSNRTRCGTNMRSVVLALHMYLGENGNVRPLIGTYTSSYKAWEMIWPVAMSPYLGIGGVAEKPWAADNTGRHYAFVTQTYDQGSVRRSSLFCPNDPTLQQNVDSVTYPAGFAWAARSSYGASWTWLCNPKGSPGYTAQDSQLFVNTTPTDFTMKVSPGLQQAHYQFPSQGSDPLQSTVPARFVASGSVKSSPTPSNMLVFGHTGPTGPYLMCNAFNTSGGWNYSFNDANMSHGGTLPFAWMDGHISNISKYDLRSDYVAAGGDPTPGQKCLTPSTNMAAYGPNGTSPVWAAFTSF